MNLILFSFLLLIQRGEAIVCYAWDSYMVFTFWDAWNQMLMHNWKITGKKKNGMKKFVILFHFLLSLCSEHITIMNLICIIDLHFKHFDFPFINSEGFPCSCLLLLSSHFLDFKEMLIFCYLLIFIICVTAVRSK